MGFVNCIFFSYTYNKTQYNNINIVTFNGKVNMWVFLKMFSLHPHFRIHNTCVFFSFFFAYLCIYKKDIIIYLYTSVSGNRKVKKKKTHLNAQKLKISFIYTSDNKQGKCIHKVEEESLDLRILQSWFFNAIFFPSFFFFIVVNLILLIFDFQGCFVTQTKQHIHFTLFGVLFLLTYIALKMES